MTTFETTIQAYLDNRNKSIKECCKYIYSKARELAKGSNSVGIDDATVYGWAVHYYDEDDIKVDGVNGRVEVATPEPASVEQQKPQPKPVQKRRRGEDNSLQLSLFGDL